ncbi:hypothetical protein MAR_002138 [Mya arenaria]|uniref:Uncharacterized protein n=1 Tax=Mya arenaria TaxID=6604 RepID=A0ABY7FDP3_MYAAR|nr:hypothetical protein MAR_002138 [Mya arenaria]
MSRSNQSYGVYDVLNYERSDDYQNPTQRASVGPYRDQPYNQHSFPQASKQMLSTVYGNAISMLEEFETEARDELLDVLKRKTIHWASVREENNCPRQKIDKYAAQIYEILDKGKTDHAFNHRRSPVITERTIRESMPHIMKGKHDQKKLDRQFRDDRNRMSPAVRRATGRNAVKLGRSRIEKENPQLKPSLDRDAQADDYFDNK